MTECLRANGLDEPLLCPDTDISDPMLSDDCSLTAAAAAEAPATEAAVAPADALWCSVSEDPVSVDTGLPLLDTGLDGPPPPLPPDMTVGASSANGRPPLSRDNSSPSRVYSVSELQLRRFDVDDAPRDLTPVSSSVRHENTHAITKKQSKHDIENGVGEKHEQTLWGRARTCTGKKKKKNNYDTPPEISGSSREKGVRLK